jgi:hypothetical protein
MVSMLVLLKQSCLLGTLDMSTLCIILRPWDFGRSLDASKMLDEGTLTLFQNTLTLPPH